jgi:HmuY protein
MINIWNDGASAMLKLDSLPNYKPFADFLADDRDNYTYTTVANQMGFDWKYFDFNTNKYFVRPNQYYIIRNAQNEFYKLQFVDFYNQQGQRGYPLFQYQRIY